MATSKVTDASFETDVIKSAEPVVVDAYEENPPNGAFIIVDADTNATAAVGFVAAATAPTDDDF